MFVCQIGCKYFVGWSSIGIFTIIQKVCLLSIIQIHTKFFVCLHFTVLIVIKHILSILFSGKMVIKHFMCQLTGGKQNKIRDNISEF